MQAEATITANMIGEFDIENEAYHASPGISASGLKLFAQSPLHYWDAYVNPDRAKRVKTPALLLGEQIHAAILEPARYFEKYYPLPEKYNRATKRGAADMEFHESQAAARYQEIITKENHEICQRIAESVRSNPAAEFLFSGEGKVEQSFYWRDPATGVLCKCRPDKLVRALNVILDLKSAEEAGTTAFQRASWNYGYHISAAFYLRGVEAVTGVRPSAFIMAAFEKKSPFACAFYEADHDLLTYANTEIDRLLCDVAECLATDEWPGYPHSIQKISLPKWHAERNREGAI